MVKKKSAIKTPVIAGVGLTIVILTPLLLLFAGIEVPIVGEVYANALGIDIVPQVPDGFEIPVPVITPSQTQQIQLIIDEIRKIQTEDLVNAQICLVIEIDPDFVGICEELLKDAQAGVLTEQLLQNAIERIEALEKEIEEILPLPDLNNTDTSIDPPPVQICDEIDCIELPPIIPPIATKTVVLSSLITKIDTQGNKTFTTGFSQIPALSFFVEDVSNIDFSKGFLEIQTKATFNANESPNPNIIGTADFDILINGESVLTDQITFEVDGGHCSTECPVPDIFCFDDACSFNVQQGVRAEFISSTGLRSPSFTFSFEENFDKFPDGLSTLEFVLINSDFTVDSDQIFQGTKNVLFSMDIAKDPNLIIIDDESGGTERVFPIDSVLKVTGATTAVRGTTCLLYEKRISECATSGCRVTLNRGSNSSPNNPDSCIANISSITFDTDTARVIGLNLLDDSGNLLQSFAGGQGEVLNELLPRNTNYTLTIASPSLTTDLSFPKSQQTQSYTCTNEYKVTYKRVEYESGLICVKCTSDGIYFRHTLEPDSFVVSKVTCNFPN